MKMSFDEFAEAYAHDPKLNDYLLNLHYNNSVVIAFHNIENEGVFAGQIMEAVWRYSKDTVEIYYRAYSSTGKRLYDAFENYEDAVACVLHWDLTH